MKINILCNDGQTITVSYSIHKGRTRSGNIRFLVSVQKLRDGMAVESFATPLSFETEETARDFMDLLARNTVMPVHLCDVYNDYMK